MTPSQFLSQLHAVTGHSVRMASCVQILGIHQKPERLHRLHITVLYLQVCFRQALIIGVDQQTKQIIMQRRTYLFRIDTQQFHKGRILFARLADPQDS